MQWRRTSSWQPRSTGPVHTVALSPYTSARAARARRVPTIFLTRGWIPPIATGVSIAAAHAGAHLARFSAEQTSGGGGGGGPNGRIPPAVAHFEYGPRAE